MKINPYMEIMLIRIMYDRGEINEPTYKKIMQKLKKGAFKSERDK